MKKGALKRQFFIAVFPPQSATEKIKDLADKGPPKWDWKRPDDYHISLAFPGALDENQLQKLIRALKGISHKSFNISFEGLSFYLKDPTNNKSSNHVIWARPDNEADNELRDLHSKIIAKMRQRKFSLFGAKDFSPHLTVARPPANSGFLTKEFAKAQGQMKTPAWRCDRFYICESLPPGHPEHPGNNNGKGSRYKKIAEIRLGP